MKVLALVHKYPPVHNAGAEVMLHAMLVDLKRRGHDCLVTYPKARPEELDGIPIRPTPPGDPGLLATARSSDVVITHLDVTPRAMRVARTAGRPLVHLVHNDGQLAHHGVNPERADLVVWNSEWIAAKFARWPGNTTIVRPPVVVADYELERAGHDITLINLTQAKGAGTFYAVAERELRRSFLGVRGAYGTQVEPPRRTGNVELVRHVPSHLIRERVYARTGVLFVPSSYESWGRVAIEACAAGIPVVAHPTEGLLESLGPAGMFAEHGKPDRWTKALKLLDNPDFYAERVALGRDRAAELERIVADDLDTFELRLRELVETYPSPNEEDPMGILSSASMGGAQCPICGAAKCACGAENSGVTVFPPSRKGQPLSTYRTARGQYRLNDDHARRKGLLPDGPELPQAVRRLLIAAKVEVDPAVKAYARANDEARAKYLLAVHELHAQALRARADDLLLELLEADPAPAAPIEPKVDDKAPAAGARVGEVLEWAGEDLERLEQAYELEQAATSPRPTLVAELARRLQEGREAAEAAEAEQATGNDDASESGDDDGEGGQE